MPEPSMLQRPHGHRIAYHQLEGVQPGVIFLGGFKSDMTGSKALTLEDWCRQHGHAFVRFDYCGHGASSGRFEDGTIGQWRDDALAVLDELTAGPQILVGSSMGGWISLLAALARPGRIHGIVTVAAAADFTETLIWQRLPETEQLRLRRDGLWQRPSEYSQDPYPISYRLIEEGRKHLLLNQNYIPINCPMRLLHGMRDDDVPWQTSAEIARRLSSDDVQVLLVKDAGHRLSREQDLMLICAAVSELMAQKPVSIGI